MKKTAISYLILDSPPQNYKLLNGKWIDKLNKVRYIIFG